MNWRHLTDSQIRNANTASALELTRAQDQLFASGVVFAISGELARAQELATELEKRFPEDTLVQYLYVPTLRAQFELGRKESIEALRKTIPYELSGSLPLPLYPVLSSGQCIPVCPPGDGSRP